MSKSLEKYAPHMQMFENLSPKVRRKLVNDDEFLKSVCEICLNVIKGNVPMDGEQLKKLRRHKKVVRVLADKGKKKTVKKVLLRGAGVFLPVLFSVVAPFISKLLTGQ